MRFRKKSVEIEAVQYTGDNGREIGEFVGYADRNELNQFVISTLEGKMCADPGDWIIRGVQGEFYPCKPDIFAATYDAVSASDEAARIGAAVAEATANPGRTVHVEGQW